MIPNNIIGINIEFSTLNLEIFLIISPLFYKFYFITKLNITKP